MREQVIKPIFTKSSSATSRALILGGFALGLILIGSYTPWLDPVKSKLGAVSASFYWLTDLPGRLSQWSEDRFVSKESLIAENERLKEELLIHRRKLQQLASIYAENVRLQQLMNSGDMVQERVMAAELIGVSPNPLAHKVVINKGSRHGVFVGQPLVDADGLMGQVIEVSPFTSQVLLITDTTHALPVQVNRNGVRAVAEGVGDLYRLELRHVSNTVDIEAGDLLVTSGLGQRFPVGYPVATVETVIHDPGQPFARIIAVPKAQLNRSRHVLLVFTANNESGAEPEATPDDTAAGTP